MKQNVRKTDNRDLMTKLFDRGINVQGIAQSLYPELSQFQIHQMLCASGPYTKDDRNLLAQKIYNVWKTEASKPDYRLGESKNVKHVNESQLKSIIAESVKKVLKEGEYDSDMLAHRMEDYHQSNGEYYASEEWYVEFGKNKYNTEKYKGFESREEAEECANKIRNEHPEMKYVSVGVNGASKMMHESKTTNKLSESQLSAIVAESIKKVLRESYNPMDDEEACQFMNWAANSSSDIMQNIWGYYQSCREGNQNDANWYMEKILFAYANEKGCEESELNIKAIEKAINEWGYYNYNESLNEAIYAYPHDYIEPLIGKELAQIEDAIGVISSKLTTYDKPNTVGNPIGRLQQDGMGGDFEHRRIQKAIKDIKKAVDDLRNCLNPR